MKKIEMIMNFTSQFGAKSLGWYKIYEIMILTIYLGEKQVLYVYIDTWLPVFYIYFGEFFPRISSISYQPDQETCTVCGKFAFLPVRCKRIFLFGIKWQRNEINWFSIYF